MILHIDDSPEIRELVNKLLGTHGYQVIQAEDGPSGLELISQLKPSLVLLDLDMPGMSGWDVIKQIKADPNLSQIQVIAFTGSIVPSDRIQLLAAGFNDFLAKPTSLVELLKIVQLYYPSDAP